MRSHTTATAASSAASNGPSSVYASESAPSSARNPSAPLVDDFAVDARPVILYDGVCNFCNGAVNIMLDFDPEGRFRWEAGTAGCS